jgi:transcription elongation GreA/GreB family factor
MHSWPSAPPAEVVLTTAGRQRLHRRLDRCLDALADLAERMSHGQRSEEDFVLHRRLLEQVEELSAVLQRAEDVSSVREDPSIVELGDEVVVEFADASVETYALVHPVEAKAADGQISVRTPLARALLGARPGEWVVVEAPAGAYTCRIRERRRLA